MHQITGTVCDINGKPRRTVVMYICDKNGKNQVESLTEVSSCEYELIVLTPLLCSHPSFRPKVVARLLILLFSIFGQNIPKKILVKLIVLFCEHNIWMVLQENMEHKIDCFPRAGSPGQPTSLSVWQHEQHWEQQQQYNPLKHMFGHVVSFPAYSYF